MERSGASWLQRIHAVRASFAHGLVSNLRSVPAVVTRVGDAAPHEGHRLFPPPATMKIRYFPDTDTLYIALAERDSSSSEVISDNLIVDFDAQGRPVGVTLEHYSLISDSSAIETLLPITPALQPA
jgi:uncharacterized protein YuzE